MVSDEGMNDDASITLDTLIGQLERDRHVQVRKGEGSDLLLKVLEPEIFKGTIIGTVVDYRVEEWVVVFKKDFYEQHFNDAASLNPLLHKAIEKIHDDLTFNKTLSEGGKKAIMLSGIDRPVGEFTTELAEYYATKQSLFYRPETSEVVRIIVVKIDDAGHQILGLQSVNGEEFVTFLETDLHLYTLNSRGERHIHSLPAQTAKVVLASVDQFRMRLPFIKRMLPVPIPHLIDGKLKFPKNGYDIDFMSFVPPDAPNIKEMSLEDAKDLLQEQVYGEFAFKSPQDKINAIAHLITPFCRGLFSRETIRSPLFIYLANREGAGKDYCAGITTITHEGEAIEDPPITKSDGNGDEEFRKKVLASFKIGRTIIHSSNNKGHLNSAELEALITKEHYVDRQLGSNTILDFPNTLTISLSANTGLTYTADLQRRSIFVNLVLDIENPNTRTFENPDLHGWVKAHRSDVLSALYALVQNWVEKGMPKSKQPFSSFPEWIAIVGGILESAGIGTPMQNDTLNSIGGDEETRGMKQLYEEAIAFWGQEWVAKSTIFVEIQNPNSNFFGLFSYLDWEKNPGSAKMRFGKILSKYVRRIFSGIRMEELPSGHHSNRSKYRFVKVEDSTANQAELQNNRIKNINKIGSRGTLATLATFPYELNKMSNHNNYIAGENNTPITPKSPIQKDTEISATSAASQILNQNPDLIHRRIETFLNQIPKQGVIVGTKLNYFSFLLALPQFSDLPTDLVEREFKAMLNFGDLRVIPRADGLFAIAHVRRNDSDNTEYYDDTKD